MILYWQARPLLAQALEDGEFNDLVDSRLQKNYEADEMIRMITCAAACLRHSAKLRPRMTQVIISFHYCFPFPSSTHKLKGETGKNYDVNINKKIKFEIRFLEIPS
jgi:hypothetical protein